jgi:hypothetical protein
VPTIHLRRKDRLALEVVLDLERVEYGTRYVAQRHRKLRCPKRLAITPRLREEDRNAFPMPYVAAVVSHHEDEALVVDSDLVEPMKEFIEPG